MISIPSQKTPPPAEANTSQVDKDAFAWRHHHIGRLLFEVQRDFQFRSLAQLKSLGYTDISRASISVIASTSLGGTRLTDIAKNLDISKQAASQMVKDLVDKGYLSRTPDPSDGRASLVTFTDKGQQFLTHAKLGVDEIEARYATWLGESTFASLREVLLDLLEHTQANP
ncbi:MAG: MarR family transcriptional regulator [Deinococcota bacterium]